MQCSAEGRRAIAVVVYCCLAMLFMLEIMKLLSESGEKRRRRKRKYGEKGASI